VFTPSNESLLKYQPDRPHRMFWCYDADKGTVKEVMAWGTIDPRWKGLDWYVPDLQASVWLGTALFETRTEAVDQAKRDLWQRTAAGVRPCVN
jgi:hypothetical protein